MLGLKANSGDLLISSYPFTRTVIKRKETTYNFTHTFGSEAANETTQWWWFTVLQRCDLEDEECSGRPPDGWWVTNWEDRWSWYLQLHKDSDCVVAEELNIDPSMVIWRLKQLERWKSQVGTSRAEHNQTLSFWSVVFLIQRDSSDHFSMGLWHGSKWSGMTASDDQLGDWTKKRFQNLFPKQLEPEKSWSLSGGLLPVSSTTKASESLQIHYI